MVAVLVSGTGGGDGRGYGEAYSVCCFIVVALNLYYLAYPFLFCVPQGGKKAAGAAMKRQINIKTFA